MDGDADWVRAWLSEDRLVPYLGATNGDMNAAMNLYQYNSRISAAIKADLDHVEVAVRNAYHRAMSARSPEWMFNGGSLFPAMGAGSDQAARAQLEKAIRDAGGHNATPGKVVAELPMGFWKRFSDQRREVTVWATTANMAFARGTPRHVVHDHMTALVQLRNRVAHGERIVHLPLNSYRARIDDLAKRIDPRIAAWIHTHSAVPAVNASWTRYQQQQLVRPKDIDPAVSERVRDDMRERSAGRREANRKEAAPQPPTRAKMRPDTDVARAAPNIDQERER